MPILPGYPANAEDVNAALALRLALAGGNMSGPLTLAGNATAALQAATLQQIPLASTTLPLMNAATAVAGNATVWSPGNHVHPTDTSRFAVAGGTITGAVSMNSTLYVASTLTVASSINSGQISSNSYIDSNPYGRFRSIRAGGNPSFCCWDTNMGYAAGMFVGGTTSLYFCDMDGGGNYTGNWYGYFDNNGNFFARGQIQAGQNMVVQGGLGILYAPWGHWYGFGWNGNVNVYVDGGYQGDLALTSWVMSWAKPSSAYTPNQNVDYNTSPTWLNPSFNVIYTTNTSSGWFSFWQYGNNAYIRYEGTWDYYAPYSGSSDARLKRDIQPTEIDALGILNQFALVQFNWRDDMPMVPKGGEPIGFTTQQLQSVFPAAVNPAPEEIPPYVDEKGNPTDGAYHDSVNTNVVLALLVGAVQQLTARLDGRA